MASDRDGLVKLKTSIKEMHKAGLSYSKYTGEFSKTLNIVSESNSGNEEDVEVGMALQKFAIITKYLSDQLKDSVNIFFHIQYVYVQSSTLDLNNIKLTITCIYFVQMSNLDNLLMFPVDRLLKNELRGGKGDLRRPCERAWKDYNDKYDIIEKQKKKQAKEAGK